MDSYRNEMGRPPPSAKNAITQTHTTPPIDKMTEKKLICMTTPNQIPTERRRGRKKVQQIKRIHEVQCSNMLYMSTQKSIYNQCLFPKHNIAPTIKLSSQPE
ncbi:hypothetical protein TNCV_4849361 [Trichonephila clavipes]|nr:hypothetical protein TNCV_4849361 [Trichonephila clavipes]